MRLSTSMIYDLGISSVQQRQQEMMRLQQQVASGSRMQTPSDDPVGATAALDVKQAQALNDQYQANGDGAKTLLSLEESALADTTALLQDVKTIAVYAGNPTLSNSDRTSLAVELESRYQELLGLANTRDANGQYLFSGYQGSTQPFSEAAPGNVAYVGDDGQRKVQISGSRAIAVNDSGDAVFRAIRNGNGTFVTTPGATNNGGGIIGSSIVTDPSRWNTAGNAKDFTIRFDVTAGVTTYDIVDNVNNVSLLTGAAPAAGPHVRTYVAGNTIDLATQSPPDTNPTPFDYGASVTITGAPASGDTFSVEPSTDQDLFSTLHGLITTLRSGTTPAAVSTATYQNSLNSAMTQLDNSLNNVLTVRAGVGSRLKEIDTSQGAGADLSLQYSKRLSDLQDLDYSKAISDLNLQQVYLQAAQQSFLRVTSLNLFEML